jgi:hypothetical protein
MSPLAPSSIGQKKPQPHRNDGAMALRFVKATPEDLQRWARGSYFHLAGRELGSNGTEPLASPLTRLAPKGVGCTRTHVYRRPRLARRGAVAEI